MYNVQITPDTFFPQGTKHETFKSLGNQTNEFGPSGEYNLLQIRSLMIQGIHYMYIYIYSYLNIYIYIQFIYIDIFN